MSAQRRIPEHALERAMIPARVAASPVAEAGVAANDALPEEKLPSEDNPLWAINVAMAAFFIVTGLVMMFT